MQKKSLMTILLRVTSPWIIGILWIASLYFLLPKNTFYTLSFWMLVYIFPPFGKETVIPFAIAGDRLEGTVPFNYPPDFVPIEPWLIAIAIASIDILAGLFMVWNFDLAKRMPLLGKWIVKTEKKGSAVMSKSHSIESLSFIGIVLFVMFPLQGTGGIGASILGRVIGMGPYKVWFAIIIGAVVGCFLIAYTAEAFLAVFIGNLLLGLIIFLMIIALAAFLIRKWHGQKK